MIGSSQPKLPVPSRSNIPSKAALGPTSSKISGVLFKKRHFPRIGCFAKRTNVGSTSVEAACCILRSQGHHTELHDLASCLRSAVGNLYLGRHRRKARPDPMIR